jgi:putative ABC transport system permease protein
LALANGIVGLSGAMFVQRSFSADINMGIGITIAGLAGLILGLVITPSDRAISLMISAIVVGGILYKALIVVSLRLGAPPETFRMVSSLVLVAVFALISKRMLTVLKGVKWT